ncbi:MAG: hypothetical protein R3A47_11440 [Polyangiales bacterium]
MESHRLLREDGLAPHFESAGIGRIYGMELKRPAYADEPQFLVIFVHVIAILLPIILPPSLGDFHFRSNAYSSQHLRTIYLDVGKSVLFASWSGSPQTPVIGSVYDALNDVYFPINGRINSERAAMFHRLDVRVQNRGNLRLKLAMYLTPECLQQAKLGRCSL